MTTPEAGLDIAALQEWWLRELAEPLAGALSGELIAGGKSNLTFRVTDGVHAWVLRRPPLGHVLATAHDMSREHRVMSALGPTNVPVPEILGACHDETVIGAPFYVMEHVAGVPYRTSEQLHPLGAARTRRISEHLIDTLAALHAVDTAAIGLADFGRPQGFLIRQVKRWSQQLESSRSRELPGIDEMQRRLEDQVARIDGAVATADGIVHGDYRLDNVLIHHGTDDDRLAAVIDWEMATYGDTLTDVALMVVYHRLAGIVPGVVASASTAAGFLTEDELLDRYSTASGRDLTDIDVYLGLASFKLLVILESVYFRHQRGLTLGDGFERVGEAAAPLLAAGMASLT